MAKRIRIFMLMALLVLGTTSIFANPDQEVYNDYYTDASLTTWCGYWYVTCGGIRKGGCQTEFVVVDYGLTCWP